MIQNEKTIKSGCPQLDLFSAVENNPSFSFQTNPEPKEITEPQPTQAKVISFAMANRNHIYERILNRTMK